jgi:hypothetical protein
MDGESATKIANSAEEQGRSVFCGGRGSGGRGGGNVYWTRSLH